MRKDGIEYKAFRHVALGSESYRIQWSLGILASLMVVLIIQNVAAAQIRLLYDQASIVAAAAAYEIFALRIVVKSLSREGDVPRSLWLINIVIDAGLPTLGLFILVENRLTQPHQALVAPAVFLYFIFIILSTLRLSPGLSLFTGLLSAVGYLAVCLLVHQRYPTSEEGPSFLPGAYFIYAALILTAGVTAAGVAGQIRTHVYKALREAELQRELDRVNQDLDLARSIQQGLLPSHSPSLNGFDVAGWNRPADETGGDYFDWQTLPDGRLAVSLGDATGHGIGPALVTASCRAYARASFLSGEADGWLTNLNRLLAEDLPQNRFVTFAVVLLDPESSYIEVLSAGHGPILCYRRATGAIENIEAQGIPLGMIAAATYGRGTELSLDAGDMLVLITDGFYEWENPEGEDFGLERLEAVIRQSCDCSSEEVISRLRSAVEGFCRGTKQNDDLTAVITKRTAKESNEIPSSNAQFRSATP